MILPSLSQTGPGIVARDLCSEFISMGHFCKIFYFDDIYGLELPCDAVKICSGNEIVIENWDIIHSHGFRPDQFVYKKLYKSSSRKCKFISTIHQPIDFKALHQTYNISKSIIGSLLWKKYLTVFDNIVVLNSDTQQKLPSNIIEKSSVIFNGRTFSSGSIDPDDEYLLKKITQKYKVIGTVSSITKRKGLEQIVKALPYLEDFAFVAIGDGDQKRKLEDLAKKLGVENRCIFLGYRSNSTDYLIYFDKFIMCTRSEGFPLALIEAASQGLPTILSDISILKAIVSPYIVDFYHLDNMNSLITTIKNSDSNKGVKLKDFYNSYLTARCMAESYIKLYSTSNYKTN